MKAAGFVAQAGERSAAGVGFEQRVVYVRGECCSRAGGRYNAQWSRRIIGNPLHHRVEDNLEIGQIMHRVV